MTEARDLQELHQMVEDQMIDRWADAGASILRTAHERLTHLYGDPQLARVAMILAAFAGGDSPSPILREHLRAVLKEIAP